MNVATVLKAQNAQLFPPSRESNSALEDLARTQGVELPPEYRQFLAFSDGAMFGETCLYGCEPHIAQPHSSVTMTLDEANEGRPAARQAVVLGASSEDLVVFDGQSGKFALADRIDLDPFDSFDSLSALLLSLES